MERDRFSEAIPSPNRGHEEIRYFVKVPAGTKTDPVLDAIAAIDAKGQLAVEWDEKKKKDK